MAQERCQQGTAAGHAPPRQGEPRRPRAGNRCHSGTKHSLDPTHATRHGKPLLAPIHMFAECRHAKIVPDHAPACRTILSGASSSGIALPNVEQLKPKALYL